MPWHQDLSLDWPVSVPPALVIWFPLDVANQSSGSLQVIPGSHKHGVIGRGHLLPEEMEEIYAPTERIVDVNLSPGDCLIFHPGVLHRSGVNTTNSHRRAINAILMHGGAFHTVRKVSFPMLFVDGSLEPSEVKKIN